MKRVLECEGFLFWVSESEFLARGPEYEIFVMEFSKKWHCMIPNDVSETLDTEKKTTQKFFRALTEVE